MEDSVSADYSRYYGNRLYLIFCGNFFTHSLYPGLRDSLTIDKGRPGTVFLHKMLQSVFRIAIKARFVLIGQQSIMQTSQAEEPYRLLRFWTQYRAHHIPQHLSKFHSNDDEDASIRSTLGYQHEQEFTIHTR